MKLLTTKQKLWFFQREIKEKGFYSFPDSFRYSDVFSNDLESFKFYNVGCFNNMKDFIEVVEIKNNIAKCELLEHKSGLIFFIPVDDLCQRKFLETILLFLITSPFIIFYNLFFNKNFKK